MDSIRIDTGEKRIMVNDDPERVIVFNPQDVGFAERFYLLIQDFEKKQVEYQARAGELDNQTVDEYGIPVRFGESLLLLREACDYLKEQIDRLFGPGTSQAAFGDALTLDMFSQFFEGVTPFFQTARNAKVAKYAPTKKQRAMK